MRWPCLATDRTRRYQRCRKQDAIRRNVRAARIAGRGHARRQFSGGYHRPQRSAEGARWARRSASSRWLSSAHHRKASGTRRSPSRDQRVDAELLASVTLRSRSSSYPRVPGRGRGRHRRARRGGGNGWTVGQRVGVGYNGGYDIAGDLPSSAAGARAADTRAARPCSSRLQGSAPKRPRRRACARRQTRSTRRSCVRPSSLNVMMRSRRSTPVAMPMSPRSSSSDSERERVVWSIPRSQPSRAFVLVPSRAIAWSRLNCATLTSLGHPGSLSYSVETRRAARLRLPQRHGSAPTPGSRSLARATRPPARS